MNTILHGRNLQASRRSSPPIPVNLQDLVGRAFQLHIVLDNRHKAVGSNSSRYLYSDSVLGSSPELFDLEVLLEPLEEQLYLPTVLVEVGYLLGCQRSRVFGCKVTNSSPLTLETAHKRLIFNDFKERLVHFNGTVV